jgi:hypothetical protein
MIVLPHHVHVRTDPDGHHAVEAVFDLSPLQAGAAAHAVQVVRDERYRAIELSTDDVLTMRELTAVADELADLSKREGHDHVHATVARLGLLRGALEEFATAEHLEREGDADARPIVFSLIDPIADLHADALHAALTGETVAARW